MEDVKKKLEIKKKIFFRLKKDCFFYKKQIEDLESLIKKMSNEYPENYEINKKKEMLEESRETLNYVDDQKEKALEDLYTFIELHLEDGTITNDLISDL